MGFTALDFPELVEHEPLRPVAGILVLVGKDLAQHVGDTAVMPQREQEFQRALADIARAPCGGAVLLHTARGGVVNHRMVRKPLDGIRQLRRDRRSGCHIEAREQGIPIRRCGIPEALQCQCPAAVMTCQRQREFAGGNIHHHIGLIAPSRGAARRRLHIPPHRAWPAGTPREISAPATSHAPDAR